MATNAARNLHRPLNRIRRHRTFRHHVTVNPQPLLAHRKIHIPAGTRRIPPQQIITRLRHTRPHPLRNLIRRPPHTVSDINDRCTFRRSYGLGFFHGAPAVDLLPAPVPVAVGFGRVCEPVPDVLADGLDDLGGGCFDPLSAVPAQPVQALDQMY